MADTLKEVNDKDTLTRHEGDEGVTISPRIDILETDEELLLFADVPGVGPDDLDIRFENGELTLHGRRSSPHEDRVVTNYQRVFSVSREVASDKISASLKEGVLTLHLPKVEAVRPRRISVHNG